MSWRPRLKIVILTIAIVSFPYLPFVPFSVLGKVNVAAQYALVALSLVLLTGWSGNISLGHAALAGTGAYVTGLLTQELHLPFPVTLAWAAIAGALVAGLLGVFALRIRGLYLAVATLIFSWMADEFLFRQQWFIKGSAVDVIPLGSPGTIPYFDWTDRRIFYYGAWAAVLIVLFMLANLKQSKSGRALAAVRGSEVAAASLGIDVIRTKLMAFALSGAIAGAAGSLVLVGQQVVTPDQFSIPRSLFFLSIAVVGGLQSLGGAIAAALLFAGLDEVFFRVRILGGYLDVVSSALLVATLLLYRGGLAAIPGAFARRFEPYRPRIASALRPLQRISAQLRTFARRAMSPAEELLRRRRSKAAKPLADGAPDKSRIRQLLGRSGAGAPGHQGAVGTQGPLDLFQIDALTESISADGGGNGMSGREGASPTGRKVSIEELIKTPRPVSLPSDRLDRKPLMEAENVTVRFGGLIAVKDFSLFVREGEIVGLIGPNGAGKTTLFNAIAGLNDPAAGRITIFGADVTRLPVHKRALLGVGRTFQVIQLFTQLSVFENLLVATHGHNHTGLFSHTLVTRAGLRAERNAREQARRALAILGLEDHADKAVGDLPFGLLRMVEVARALVTGARVIMLDEPASGLDNAETDRLMAILRYIRGLGVTLLLIEHDVRMVTSVSDYIYVIDRGSLLAEGLPNDVKSDPAVISAYLGEASKSAPMEASTR